MTSCKKQKYSHMFLIYKGCSIPWDPGLNPDCIVSRTSPSHFLSTFTRNPKILKANTVFISFLNHDGYSMTHFHVIASSHPSLGECDRCWNVIETMMKFSWWAVSEALLSGTLYQNYSQNTYDTVCFIGHYPYWNHMIFFHLRNKHSKRSVACYKAFKQHKLVILRSSSHIHYDQGQVSISHGHLCVSQITVMETQMMGRVTVGPRVKAISDAHLWHTVAGVYR